MRTDPRQPVFERNLGTMVFAGDFWRVTPLWTMKDQFERCYSDIRALLAAPTGPGCLAVVVHANHGVVGSVEVPMVAPGAAGGVAVVGRHTQAPLQLADDPTVALRHMVIRVTQGAQRIQGSEGNQGSDGEPEVRLLDLNTGHGFHIEGAGVFQGCRVSGPAFVRIGSYAVMLFPRGDVPRIWPAAEAAPAAAPAGLYDSLATVRVEAEDRRKSPDGVPCVMVGRQRRARDTLVVTTEAPIWPRPHPAAIPLPADTYGVLTIDNAAGRALFALTAKQLEQGVLMGRYERCEVGFWTDLDSRSVSRVHALLLKEGDQVLAVDTASTYGTSVNGSTAPVTALADDALLELGPGNEVRWVRVIGEGEVN